MTIPQALVVISNKHAELKQEWAPALQEIRATQNLTERYTIYEKARKRIGPHSIMDDEQLKLLLDIK